MHTLTEIGTLNVSGFIVAALAGAATIWALSTAGRSLDYTQLENPP